MLEKEKARLHSSSEQLKKDLQSAKTAVATNAGAAKAQ